jgi:hypothetical protein
MIYPPGCSAVLFTVPFALERLRLAVILSNGFEDEEEEGKIRKDELVTILRDVEW